MMQSFLSLLLATCVCRFATNAITQEDRTVVWPDTYRSPHGSFLFDYDGYGNRPIYDAVQKQITSSTCITFQKINSKSVSNENYFFFEWNLKAGSCTTMEIKKWNCNCRRTLTIGRDCATTQLVLLNFLRGLGLDYHHKRSDRYLYARLTLDVFLSGGSWYKPVEGGSSYGLPFDPLSIMHPSTKSGREGLIYDDEATGIIAGKAKTLSFYDKKALNLVYKCDKNCSPYLPKCLNEGYRLQSDDCECQCRKGFWGFRCENNANSHHLYNIFTMDQAKEIVTHIEDTIASSFNAIVASSAVYTVKHILSGNTPTMLIEEEVESRDVFAITLGKLSLDYWGREAVVKLGGKPGQKLGDVLKGHLPDIIHKVTKDGGHHVVGQAFGHTMGIHFARSLGRGAVCVVKKLGKDIVNGVKWVGGKLKSGCKAVYNTLKNAAGKLYHKLASFFHFW